MIIGIPKEIKNNESRTAVAAIHNFDGFGRGSMRPLPRLSACASWICFFPIIVRPLRWSVFSFSGRKCRSHKSRWHLRTDINHCMPGPNRVARWGRVSWRRFPGVSRLLRVRRFPGNIHRTIGCNFHCQVVSWRVFWRRAWLLRILPSRTRLWLLPGFVRKLLCSKGRIERKVMNTSQVIITPGNITKDRKLSICVFLSGFSCFAQLYYFQPLLPDLAQEFGLSASHSSLAISFSTLGMVIGLFTAMFVADTIPRKKLISAALLSSAVFSVICSCASIPLKLKYIYV